MKKPPKIKKPRGWRGRQDLFDCLYQVIAPQCTLPAREGAPDCACPFEYHYTPLRFQVRMFEHVDPVDIRGCARSFGSLQPSKLIRFGMFRDRAALIPHLMVAVNDKHGPNVTSEYIDTEFLAYIATEDGDVLWEHPRYRKLAVVDALKAI